MIDVSKKLKYLAEGNKNMEVRYGAYPGAGLGQHGANDADNNPGSQDRGRSTLQPPIGLIILAASAAFVLLVAMVV